MIVAVDRLPRVVDGRDYAIGKSQNHHCRVDIAGLADGGIDHDGGSGVNLIDLTANEKPRHIKVVDGHVQKEAAGAANVRQRGRRRIPADDMHQVRSSDFAIHNGFANTRVVRIEAAVEAHLQLHAGALDGRQSAIDPGKRLLDRFLAKNMLAGGGRLHHEVFMGVGGGTNQHRLDARIGDHRLGVGGHFRDSAARGKAFRGHSIDVCNRHHRRFVA